ncbi:MAG: hypothetical protein E6K17_09170 [Methanobacteriota archaeon]|nr:MAG: hypothetical protein E6K17_09170 [Euryarchaeota archaeon]
MASRFAPAIDAVDYAIRAVKDRAPLAESGTEAVVFFLAIVRHPEGQSVLHLPFSISEGRLERDAFEISVGEGRVFVSEAEPREAYVRFVADAFEHQAKVPTMAGDVLRFRGEPLGVFRAMGPPLAGDSTNLLVRFSTARAEVVFKSYKIPDVHNREPEILERLHRKQFRNAPRYLGEVALGQGPERLVVGLATEFVESVDLFTWMTDGWREELTQTASASGEFEPATLEIAGTLGDAAAALHEALFDRHPGPWQAETFRSEDATAARRGAITNLGESLRRLSALAKGPDRRAAEVAMKARTFLFDQRPAIEEVLRGLDANLGTPKSVTHGDLHLGQVLRRHADGGLLFIDFEGEPERSPGQRSLKLPPLRDVATMNRSFSYVKHYAWRTAVGGDAMSATRLLEREGLAGSERSLAERLLAWEAACVERFTSRYLGHTTLYEGLRPDEAHRAIHGWMMEKALYEFRYELKYRPANIFIPLEGITTLSQGRLA